MAKYKIGVYKDGSLCGGSNISLNLITCTNKNVIMLTLQRYVLHWYHTYLFHAVNG